MSDCRCKNYGFCDRKWDQGMRNRSKSLSADGYFLFFVEGILKWRCKGFGAE